MTKHTSHKRTQEKIIRLILLLSSVAIIAYTGLALYLLNLSDIHMRSVISARKHWLETNKTDLMYIYTNVFPRAAVCNPNVPTLQSSLVPELCKHDMRQLIDTRLATTLGYDSGISGRLPIFFIRLRDENTIEKLYQSGDYLVEEVNTKGEKMIVEMLQGKRHPFAYPQYTCCGGDDILPGIPIVNLFLPPRLYLKDFPTEIEQIYLIRDENNEILGGLVYLYGD